ncbi:DUF916 and DUF3324 domain-containing protein [Companilactobacillus mishanensis]|uniref:DUF916 and DUF3324 domain-containing protein n=1 Tax=Companilactobacillus mishanensis TaxID=2486008 RepID=UPI000F7AEF47|nr:DUF916 and DUF3324 domain-containing protein [Companilactobacillus mishanensis]
MKKFWLAITFSLIALFGVFFGGQTIANAESLKFTVSAVQPDSQIDKKTTYFDMLVKPNEDQNLTVKITNSDKKAHKYRVSINRAGTNSNGVIDYSTHGVKPDKSLKNNVESLVPAPTTVTVPAQTTQDYNFTLKTPAKDFGGVILGGVRVQQVSQDSSSKKKGVSIRNKFAYVIGLQLHSNEDYVAPDMKLLGVKAKQMNYRNYVTANLQNTKPTIMHDLVVNAKVHTQGKKDKVLSVKKTNMSMAPNSNFDFPIGTNGKALKAGKYTLVLDAKAEKGRYHWHFTKNFVITDKTANKLNKSAVDQEQGPNYFIWILVAIIIVIILLGIIIYLNQKNQKKRRE